MRSWASASYRAMTPGSSISEDVLSEAEEEEELNEINSEVSFGTKIQNLAQKSSAANLEPGIKHKPPLPIIKRSTSPKKEAPPGVSMSKAYQDRFYKETDSLESDRAKEPKEAIVNTKLDLYFKQWEVEPPTDPKMHEIEIFEQETDFLFKKLRSHQEAFSEYVEESKTLPLVIESVVQPEISEAKSREVMVTDLDEEPPAEEPQQPDFQFSLLDYDKRLLQDQEYLATNSVDFNVPEEPETEVNETKVVTIQDTSENRFVDEAPQRDVEQSVDKIGEVSLLMDYYVTGVACEDD